MIVREQLEKLVMQAGLARRMAAMLGSGVTLGRSLEVVAGEAGQSPLAEVLGDVHASVMGGETLSEAVRDHGDWFDAVARALIRAGEVGGVLDVTMHRWAELLARQIEQFERLQQYELLMQVAKARPAFVESGGETAVRQTMAANQPRIAASLFLDAFGVMLGSGVPLRMALTTAADMLPRPHSDQVKQIAQELGETGEEADLAGELSAVPGLSGTVQELIRVGEMTGTLDETCADAADLLRAEAESEIRAAMMAW